LVNGTENAVSLLANTALNKMNSVVFSDKSAIPALRLAWLSKGILIKVQKNPKSVISGILYPSEFIKKLLLFSKVIKRTF
jgi:predicted NAD/FAD-binding protein